MDKLLDKFGLTATTLVMLVVLLVLLAMVIFLSAKVFSLSRKYDKFMRGRDAETLEDAILDNFSNMKKLMKAFQQTKSNMDITLNSIRSTYQKMGLVKYDAFKEMGGNLSFALAMLDADDCGFILNSMHGRESCYTYVKEIIKGESYTALGEEEKEALEKALSQAKHD
ncbi:DUF4446 family protein [Eubacterium sp.]|uniref:DUF4446 family protein n=1 Tax=Eubacterium sp. TaxID=142586 RepID=UPI0025FFF9C9|nr:DUF4446 family protein [Eubacterium sp.]MCR5630125.1 DUF4446 family protein [Eubacterium sp.]